MSGVVIEGWFLPRLKSAYIMVQTGALWACVLEREKEDNGRAVFGGQKAVFIP